MCDITFAHNCIMMALAHVHAGFIGASSCWRQSFGRHKNTLEACIGPCTAAVYHRCLSSVVLLWQ